MKFLEETILCWYVSRVSGRTVIQCIFTSEMKETVLVQLTEYAKSRKVLDFLPKRGSKAFHLFCQALEKNNQSHLDLQLKREDDGT